MMPHALIKADEKEMAFFNALPDAQKTSYVLQKTNTFEDILGEDGEVTGFKVNYSLPTLTAPQEADYRKEQNFGMIMQKKFDKEQMVH